MLLIGRDAPTTSPRLLMAAGSLWTSPGSVPRSTITVPDWRNACVRPSARSERPMICPALLIPVASL
jgi:hypothetical protein